MLKEGGIFYNAVLANEELDKLFYTQNGFIKFAKKEYIAIGKSAGFRDINIRPLRNNGLLIIYRK